MSISEFIVENGYGPWFEDPYYNDGGGGGSGRRRMDVDRPNPETNAEWMKLVKNPAFASAASTTETNINKSSSENHEIVTAVRDATIQITAQDGHQHEGLRTVSGEAMQEMHPGALAPRWVLECKNPIHGVLHNQDNLMSYQRRLLCALHGRFVCTDRWGPSPRETLRSSHGIPQVAVRYCWRYWDNHGNVYEDVQLKWRRSMDWELSDDEPDDLDGTITASGFASPGDFAPRNGSIWMREPNYQPFMYGVGGRCSVSSIPHHTNVNAFWENMWSWTFAGSTKDPCWDEALERLAKSAGVAYHVDHQWPLQPEAIDKMAVNKGWTKINCRQPTVAAYKREEQGAHLHFHLSSGTVVTIDKNEKIMKRLFNRDMTNVSALLDVSNNQADGGEVSGKGTRKRKDAPGPIHRTCSSCGASKTSNEFSKNQRRKGSGASCKLCIDERRKGK